MKAKLLLAGLVILSSVRLTAQQFGAFPPSTNWQQINTDTARIIFSPVVTTQAERIAAIIHRMQTINANSLGNQVRKIHILLHPNTILANGYVALGPFRSEYYLIPSSNIFEFGATPWNEDLAVHEYRHVQQYSNFNKGLSKAASIILGQNGQAFFNALSIPDWFFEGDAVHNETVFTNQGRGRAPYFFNGFNALWQDQREYSWMKLRNGSYKDYVPNHYPLGYMITNYGYLKYGPDFWGKVTDDAARFKSLFYPFQHAVKKYSGKDYKTFREEALDFYKHEVSTRRDHKLKRETVTDYLFPQMIGDDSLLYIKTAYNKLAAFYIKDKSGEHRIKLRNITTEDWLSYRNGTIAYTAYTVHPRWGLTDYSNIYLVDIHTGEEKRITNKAKYFTPDISPDGTKIVAVFFNDSAQCELHLLNMDGSLVKKIKPSREGDLFVHPRFADNQSIVVAVRHLNSTMSLQRLSLPGENGGTGKPEMLVQSSTATLGYPFIANNKIYFVSSASGNDDVYSVDLADHSSKFMQLTSGVTGNYYPSAYKDTLVWSNFTSNGFRIRKGDINTLKKVELKTDIFSKRILPYKVATDSTTPNVLSTTGVANYPVKKYKKTTGLFNFHSRQVDYTDPELTVSIFSDNILNTFSNEIFYRYNQDESSHAVGFSSFYGGFFPVLNAGITYTADRTIRTTAGSFTLNQTEAQVGYYIPLNFTGGNMFKSLSFGSSFVYSETSPTAAYKNSFAGQTANYLRHFINWSQQLPQAVQHIFPKFGYAINLTHRHLLSENGFQFLGGTRVYLPSIKNHSIVIAANWQETDTSNVTFSNRFANSRGYNDYFFSRMWRLSGNYHLPLIYPDWGFGNIVYCLRIRGNAFYDFTRVYSKDKLAYRNQRSVGGEVYFDTKWWNEYPVSFGFRVSHLLDNDFSGARPTGSNIFEFIVPVDLIPR